MKKYNLNPSEELLKKLRPGFINRENYITSITSIPRPSHDIFPLVKYNGKEGILLITRKYEPAKDMIWCLGGRHQRGYLMRDSLAELVKKECNLELYDILCLSREPIDLFWDKDPFNHGKGVHDTCTPYFARTRGDIQLNKSHSNPLIIAPLEFAEIKNDLHWYVKENT